MRGVLMVSDKDRDAAIEAANNAFDAWNERDGSLAAAMVDGLIALDWGPRPTVSPTKLGEFIDAASRIRSAYAGHLAEKILASIEAVEQVGHFGRAPISFVVNGDHHYAPHDVQVVYMEGDTERAAVARHCAGDREIVAEVMSWKHFYDGNDEWYSCGLSIDPSGFGGTEPGSGCANDDDRGRCTCSLEARQLRILEPLARVYGVTP